MSLTEKREHYKPFNYPWAFEAFHLQKKMDWLPDEVPLQEDIDDWNVKLADGEKSLLTQLFRFFTQADADIASGYYERYIPAFPHPELRMMMGAFASMEGVHMYAYSVLLDTIGMPETEYQAFHEFEVMKAKHEYLFNQRQRLNSMKRLALDIAIFSAFGEGMQLFSTFAILLSFKQRNLMKGMSTIIEWSLKDETLHVESMIRLFRTLVQENPSIWTDSFKKELYQTCREMVELEDSFIDLAFAETGEMEGITAAEVKTYIRYIADRRLLQLGLKPNYGVTENPFQWLDWMMSAHTHTNFFEGRATEYSKGGVVGWDQAYSFLNPNREASADASGERKKTLVIYTKEHCPYCSLLKTELANRGIPFTAVDLSDDDVRSSFYSNTGTNTVPQVYITDQEFSETAPSGVSLGGYTEVSKLLSLLPKLFD